MSVVQARWVARIKKASKSEEKKKHVEIWENSPESGKVHRVLEIFAGFCIFLPDSTFFSLNIAGILSVLLESKLDLTKYCRVLARSPQI